MSKIAVKGKVTPVVKPSEFEIVARKGGEIVVREITASGKKLNLATITEAGFKLRPKNQGSVLALDSLGRVRIAA